MDLKELGSRLKDERERQGLTMEQIMEITKVSRVNINAIESGDQKEFPHEVYAKGFIKTYAKALGLNAEEIGDEFSRIMGSGTTETAADDVVETVQPGYSVETKKSPVGTIILILLLAGVVGGLVYYLHDNSFFSAKNETQTEIVAEEAVQEKPAAEPQVEAPAVDEIKAGVVEPAPAEVEQSVATDAPAEEAAEAVETPVAEAEKVVAEPVGNTVAITAKPGEACWLEAVVDGSAKEYVLQEGETLSLPFEDSLKLKLGNGGGVEIASNGKPYSFDAPKGQVKKLEFSAAQ